MVDYDPAVFDRLPQFREAKASLARHHDQLSHPGEVIVGHGLHETIGVSLLHQHFPLFCNEVLVRRFEDANYVTMAPSRPTDRSVPYLWQVQRNGEGWAFVPLEFVEVDDQRAEDVERVTAASSFLQQMADSLATHGLTEVFGIATTNIKELRVAPEEILVETTDAAERVLTIRPEGRAGVDIHELTETFWTFTPEHSCNRPETLGTCKASQHCQQHCKQHCHAHCKNHCFTHCTGHCKQHCKH
jgi:hypothetical protein